MKWWGNGILAPHYFEALREAARLGAERALNTEDEKPGPSLEIVSRSQAA